MEVREIVEGQSATEVAKLLKDNFEDLNRESSENRKMNYGFNVTVNGVTGGRHTLETAIADVEEKNRMIGQVITFQTNDGKWQTWKNVSASIDGYERIEEWSQEIGSGVGNGNTGYGFNVTVNGVTGGQHTIETAIADVEEKNRMIGQVITFQANDGKWQTWKNVSASIDGYERIEEWEQQLGGDVENNPDGEDLTSVNGQLKLADKIYNKDSFSGLGRVYVRKNYVDGVNVLEQDMVNEGNTIYIIQYDHDLQGREIVVPDGCVMDFAGGSIKNGTIVLGEGVTVLGRGALITTGIIVRGKDITIKDLSVECAGICICDDNSSDVSNLTIDGCRLKSTGDNCVKIIADELDGTITGIRIVNTDFIYYRMGVELQNHGTEVYRFKGGVISQCNFTMCDRQKYNYGYAVSLSGYGEHMSVTECCFDMCYLGVELVGFNYSIIANNKFKYIIGVYNVAATNFRRMQGTIICNNVFIDRRLYIVNTQDFQILGNHFYGSNGVILKESTRGLFANNRCIFSSYADTGVMLENTSRTRVEDNQLDMSQSTTFYSVMRAYGASASYNIFRGNVIAKPDSGAVWDQQNGASNNRFIDYFLQSNGNHVSQELDAVKNLVSNGDSELEKSIRTAAKGSYTLANKKVVSLVQGENNAAAGKVSSPEFVIRKEAGLTNNKISVELTFMFRQDNNQYWAKVRLTDATFDQMTPVVQKEGSLTAEVVTEKDEDYVYYKIKFTGSYNDAIVYGTYFCSSTHWFKWYS